MVVYCVHVVLPEAIHGYQAAVWLVACNCVTYYLHHISYQLIFGDLLLLKYHCAYIEIWKLLN